MSDVKTVEKGFALMSEETGSFFDSRDECWLTGSPDTCNIFIDAEDAAQALSWEGFDLDHKDLSLVPMERTVTVEVGEPMAWPDGVIEEAMGIVDGDEL